jgi:hypothetical protein
MDVYNGLTSCSWAGLGTEIPDDFIFFQIRVCMVFVPMAYK